MIIEECNSPESWNRALAKLPDFPGKVYYSQQYFKLLAANKEGKPKALAFFGENHELAFYPFLLKRIPKVLTTEASFDIETPYGYGGPFFSTTNKAFIEAFHQAQHAWCLENSVVAEFIRFNPLVGNHTHYQKPSCLQKNRTTVSINTQKNLNEILRDASHNRQRNFRKALSQGLVFARCTVEEFSPLYAETMREVGAQQYYFFSPDYFSSMASSKDSISFIRAAKTPEGKIAAAAIFLHDKQSIHFHLGASRKDLLHLRPNEFLFFKVAEEAFNSGKQLLHLGGGLSDCPEDPLFRFKKGFSQQTHDFFIGKVIHNQEKYNSLSRTWQEATGKKPDILLHYHYGA